MQALILVGGLGTRLRQIVNDRPKPLADINGKPFLEYQLEYLKKNHVKEIVLCTGYQSEKFKEYFLDGSRFGLTIRYSHEIELLGTGGAIKNAMNLLEEQFLILNGDTLFLTDIQNMKSFHEKHNAKLTIALTRIIDSSRFGNVFVDGNNKITKFNEKIETSFSSNLINCGLYLCEKDCFKDTELPSKFSLEYDFIPKLIPKQSVYGHIDNSYFIDIGTVTDYQKIKSDLESGKIII